MGAATLDNMGQLPRVERPKQGVNYAALSADVCRLRHEIARDWASLSPKDRAGLYGFALARVEERPQFFKAVASFPRVWRAYQAGTLGDFMDYAREVERLLDKILSLSENENPALQSAFLEAVESAVTEPSAGKLRNRQDINDWLRSLV